MSGEVHCTTCGKSILGEEDQVRFDCPRCGEERIIRCKSCRVLKNQYTCSECDFTGP